MGHCFWSGKTQVTVNLSECRSFDDIVEKLKEYIDVEKLKEYIEKTHPDPDTTVFADNYNHVKLREGTHPDRFVLDRASDTIPIQLTHVSGHVGCGNTPCIRQAGFSSETPDPEGGRICRITGTNEPNGFFEEAAYDIVRAASRPHFHPDIEQLAACMQQSYASHGVTTIQDGHTTGPEYDLLRQIADQGYLKLDTVCYLSMPLGGVPVMHKIEEYSLDYVNHIRIGGYKMILDGSLSSRTAFLSSPYEGEKEYRGYPSLNDDTVVENIKLAISEGRRIFAHCIGDAAADQFINAYEIAATGIENLNELRPVMIHCTTVRKDQLQRMKRLGMIASLFMMSLPTSGDIYVNSIGGIRGDRMLPCRDVLDAGLVMTFHQDSPITPSDMIKTVSAAVNRITRSGRILGNDQRIGVYDALKAVTVNAAYQYGEEESKGTIEAGKRADLVILDRSPLSVSHEKLNEIKILETIKDGETVYQI